ncbi:MAG: NYN domain-containing protein [Clostridia bacterium]|nr:NYN domain-containing protein [Clostridia bacterium]
MEKKQKAAMLIDAENIPVSYVEQIFSYAETYGSLAVREIYGDALSLSNWEEAILRYLIHPNLSVRILKGKNSSDIALTIGAMDLLSRKDIDTVIECFA